MRCLQLGLSIVLAILLIATPASADTPFSDVPANHWGLDAINYLAELEIIRGYDDQTFRPAQTVTRADAAIMIARALDLDIDESASAPFSDVSPQFYAYHEIAAVAEAGIIQGFNGRFSPRNDLTRGQMAAILQRAFHLSGTSNYQFSDVGENHLFYSEIQTLIANLITNGYSDRTFRPDNSMRRDEFATFIARALDENFRGITFPPAPGTEDDDEDVHPFEREVLERTNEERAKHGLDPLAFDQETQKVARLKSEDMRDHHYFSHTSPTYGSPFEMMSQFGINYSFAGENIAAGQTTPSEVVEAWMNSEGHRQNILNPNYTHLGVGYAEGGSMRHYWTQMFVGY